ncbi:hypothetical protein [Stenotrophomonas sp.]|uniref:hypothetical protein n=1 Tax=Stenotrophomonas sp. TaxID=69392 RepID=UPI002FC70BF1
MLEMLKDYSELTERLQEVRKVVTETPPSLTSRLGRAKDKLHGRIDPSMVQARPQLDQAVVSGEPCLIAATEAKFSLMSQARLERVWMTDEVFP